MEKEQREEVQRRQEQAVGAEGPPPGLQAKKSAGEEASASSGPSTATQHWPLGHLANAGGLAAAASAPAQEQRPNGGHDHPAEAGGRPHTQPGVRSRGRREQHCGRNVRRVVLLITPPKATFLHTVQIFVFLANYMRQFEFYDFSLIDSLISFI